MEPKQPSPIKDILLAVVSVASIPDDMAFTQKALSESMLQAAKMAANSMTEEDARNICKAIIRFAEELKPRLAQVEADESFDSLEDLYGKKDGLLETQTHTIQ